MIKSRKWKTTVPGTTPTLAIYFTLTGLHALHVIGGAMVIGFLWGPGSKMWKTDPERFTNRIEVSGLFWHFVDLVWIFFSRSCTCFNPLIYERPHTHDHFQAARSPLPVRVLCVAFRHIDHRRQPRISRLATASSISAWPCSLPSPKPLSLLAISCI